MPVVDPAKVIPKIRIESKGTPPETKIINLETGEEMKNVVELSYHLEAGMPKATISLVYYGSEVEADLQGEDVAARRKV